ncbi:efflux RND transporter periplasmic adaptor subunit [Parasphingorhabdus sp. JC815]|uniref:efflux RND transporter periplasmic adaptor subunit n=1 Tax=Parasphingorhabdus sp. JC815 TaxID=3232140 RepID=UPI003458B2C4
MVDTYVVKPVSIPNIIELPGRIEAVRVAEVRARVNGIVQRRLYREGTDVSKGQPLFRIDPSELQATRAQVKASLERAQATAANARAVVNRYKPLVAEQAISRQEYDAAVAASREASASVAQIKAELAAADLQLGYTNVRAPIRGRARRAEVTEGALVSAAEATLLTRIEQLNPVYVNLSQSSSEVMAVRRAVDEGLIEFDERQKTRVELSFEDGSIYPIEGFLDFFDFSVDENTGTVSLRAEFPNPGSNLLPGEFVRAKIYLGEIKNGIEIPQRAVQLSETGASVLIIDSEGKAAVRSVDLGPLDGDKWIIKSGLSVGDKVIISNLQKIRPGAAVKILTKEQRGRENKQPSSKSQR